MSQFVETCCKTFTTAAAIDQHLRVKLDSTGKVSLAGIADKDIGTLEQESFADGDVRAVRLSSAVGTRKCVAAAAITRGARVFTAAAGKVSNTAATAFQYGTALEAAAADLDVIEVLHTGHGDTAAV